MMREKNRVNTDLESSVEGNQQQMNVLQRQLADHQA